VVSGHSCRRNGGGGGRDMHTSSARDVVALVKEVGLKSFALNYSFLEL